MRIVPSWKAIPVDKDRIFGKLLYLSHMGIRDIVIKILREERIQTETQYLGWSIPEMFYDELKSIGLKYDEKPYVAEIQFDTKSVVFEFISPDENSSFKNLKIDDLPRGLKTYIRRKLKKEWIDIMGKFI